MVTWSRDQSQRANTRGVSSGLKATSLGNLQTKTEKQKARDRSLRGIRKLWSQDREPPKVQKVRDYLCVMRDDWKPAKPRGRSGCRLSDAMRLKIAQRHALREAFFADV